jgi:peptide/nickel transport system substrate-binding protein
MSQSSLLATIRALLPAALRVGVGCLLIVLTTGGLTGCSLLPPTAEEVAHRRNQVDEGVPVEPIAPNAIKHQPPTTRYTHGVDWAISRYPSGRYGGQFYQALSGNGPQTLNPWASFDGTSSTLGGYLVSGLLDTDPFTGEVGPALAKGYTVSPDGQTITVALRRGLKWSDGHPLTSKDVVFTWNVILKQGLGNPSMRDILTVKGQFPQVKALDAQTIQFKTVVPFAPFLRGLSTPIAPAHVFAPLVAKGGDDAFRSAWTTQLAATHPDQLVASGPWVLASYEPGIRIVYKRNPHFWMQDRAGQRLPYVDQLVFSFVKNENNQQLQFEQGALDTYDVPSQYLQRVRHLKRFGFRIFDLGPTSGSTFLAFNLKPDASAASPWLANKALRQAVDWTVDRPRLVANILHGVGQPLFTAEGLNALYLHPTLRSGHPRDVAKARGLLQAAGFAWNAEGQLLDPKGKRVELTLLTNSGNDVRESTGVQLQQDLAELGLTVYFKPVEFNVMINRMHTGDWELMVMGLSGGSTLEPHFSANVWRSDGALHMMNQRDPKSGTPPAPLLPWEREVDRLLDSGVTRLAFDERAPFYWQYQAIVADEVPMVYLYAPRSLVAVKSGWRNLAFTPLGGPWHNLEAIWRDRQGLAQ